MPRSQPSCRIGTTLFQLLEPHATTPEMHDALDGLMTASDRASLNLAVNRLEAAFAGAGGPTEISAGR